MTKAEIQAAYDALKGEYERLLLEYRGHVCPPVIVPNTPQCLCGTSARCYAHYPAEWTGWINPGNACAGAAGMAQTLLIPAGQSYSWQNPAAGCAGGVPQIMMITVPA